MNKEKAIDILEDWISEKTQDHNGEPRDMRLPIVDEVIYSETKEGEVSDWTFKGLIKIAYNLTNK